MAEFLNNRRFVTATIFTSQVKGGTIFATFSWGLQSPNLTKKLAHRVELLCHLLSRYHIFKIIRPQPPSFTNQHTVARKFAPICPNFLKRVEKIVVFAISMLGCLMFSRFRNSAIILFLLISVFVSTIISLTWRKLRPIVCLSVNYR